MLTKYKTTSTTFMNHSSYEYINNLPTNLKIYILITERVEYSLDEIKHKQLFYHIFIALKKTGRS